MKIVINSIISNYVETISLEKLDKTYEIFKKFSDIKVPLKAKIFAINESISSHQLLKFKKIFDNINICSLCIYSNNRDTILAGKSLKIDSTFVKEKEVKNKLILLESKNKDDILHQGTIRSGDRISSNGNLCIIGDVNPGGIVSAKKNIYVWGKLLGIAIAGKGGNNNASITSLYLSPLQLRIADVIAIGPKDKPKNYYPEIAVIEKQTINIKPYLVET
ncbi:septum site-determining protein MinC [Prochlorococcus marinus str. MU1404]|uniref:septum site-determining protein MinC n=1 Tax=Prochlorococcus marinus TaxID=1219 RepID=UPI001AD95ED0|nr:septum site-determining protein MinC [Prochlorococcus marinus]MBO8229495.1 septum site-determining protein MinC [Prochlorococcus marinus XMU1404]MBW3072578.1 septum site-determining protein MinC [Prochlorococcus marinus str. MU1404]MCR8546169.1 septum site-determining protein MinC [Prochlorococcus marinus CUG1432]